MSVCRTIEGRSFAGLHFRLLKSAAMNPTSDPSRRRSNTAWRTIRYLVRSPLLIIHALIAAPMVLVVFNPLSRRVRIGDERLDQRATRWWSGRILRIFGMRIRAFGSPLPGAVLFVANHLSWLDIELIHSQRAIHFVAKAEIAHWPLVGWLASHAGTIFHRRGDTHSMASVMQRGADCLRAGAAVGVFPEGGSGYGDRVGTFHARIFQMALDADVPVQPVALRYGVDGRQDLHMPFARRESFMANFLRVLGAPPMDAEVHFLPPIENVPDARRRMAEASRAAIVAELGYGD